MSDQDDTFRGRIEIRIYEIYPDRVILIITLQDEKFPAHKCIFRNPWNQLAYIKGKNGYFVGDKITLHINESKNESKEEKPVEKWECFFTINEEG